MLLTRPNLPPIAKVRVTVRDLTSGKSKTVTLYETDAEEVIGGIKHMAKKPLPARSTARN